MSPEIGQNQGNQHVLKLTSRTFHLFLAVARIHHTPTYLDSNSFNLCCSQLCTMPYIVAHPLHENEFNALNIVLVVITNFKQADIELTFCVTLYSVVWKCLITYYLHSIGVKY